MAKPMFQANSACPVTFGETDTRLYLAYEIYDKETLVKDKFYSAHKIRAIGRDGDFWKVFFAPGSQIAYSGICRVYNGTFGANPNLLDDVGNSFSFLETGNSLVFTPGNGMYCMMIHDETGEVLLTNDEDSNYTRMGVAIRLNDEEFLVGQHHSYYDRVYLFSRVRVVGGSAIHIVHGARVNHNSATFGFLTKTDTKVFAYTSHDGNYFTVWSYDISQQSASKLIESRVGKNATYVPSQFHPDTASSNQKIFYVARPDTNTFTIEMYTLDVQNNTCSKKNCTVTFTGSNIFFNTNDNRMIVGCFITSTNSNNYLNIIVQSRVDYKPDGRNFKIYTFQIDSTDPSVLTFVTQKDLKQQTTGVIFLDDNRTKFVIGGQNDAVTYVFENDEWVDYPLGIGQVSCIALDSYKRLWIRGPQYTYYMLTPTLPAKVFIKFDRKNVVFDGTPVTANVIVSAYNFEGQRISVTGTLKILSGDATFKDGSIEKEITTSATGDVTVPIVIKGVSRVRVGFDYKIGSNS